jgi:hypothetical protein
LGEKRKIEIEINENKRNKSEHWKKIISDFSCELPFKIFFLKKPPCESDNQLASS